jgi:hypothetical protein
MDVIIFHSDAQEKQDLPNTSRLPLTFYRYPPKGTTKLEEFYELGAIRLLCMDVHFSYTKCIFST